MKVNFKWLWPKLLTFLLIISIGLLLYFNVFHFLIAPNLVYQQYLNNFKLDDNWMLVNDFSGSEYVVIFKDSENYYVVNEAKEVICKHEITENLAADTKLGYFDNQLILVKSNHQEEVWYDLSHQIVMTFKKEFR